MDASEFNIERYLSGAMNETERAAFKQMLAADPAFSKRVRWAAVKRRRYIFAGIASVAIVAVIFLWPSPGYIDRWGQMKMENPIERGGGTDTLLLAAAVLFNKTDYDKALPLLDKALMIDSSSQVALFYRGVCLFFTGAASEARTDLQRVYNGSSVFRYEAAFFMALGYADEKNAEKTREWLKKIPPGTPVSERAGELKEALDEGTQK
ncbi:MAG: hypothetical protein ACO1NW_06815 [Chitinophagaceae bacterium]